MVEENHLGGIYTDINAAIGGVEDALDEIPEWDRALVRDLVTDHAGRDSTMIRTIDSDVCIEFEVGPYGEATEIRYEVAVGDGNEWLFVKRDDEWDEVWSN